MLVKISEYLSSQKIGKFLHKNTFWLPFWLLFGAGLCAYNQYDFFWDLMNYHYYNAWAFLEDISAYNILNPPGGMNTLLNPLLDIPLYYLISYFNDNVPIIYAVQGLCFGLLLFVFQKICLLFFKPLTYFNIIALIICLALAMTGQATWFQAGSSTNEVQISVIVMACLYFMLKYIKYPKLQSTKKMFFNGFLIGTALALKPTCLSYVIASGICLIIFHKRLSHPYKYIFIYGLGAITSFILLHGYFMYQLYIEYGNPFLPALNNLFETSFWGHKNLIDTRYIHSGLKRLYYPYTFEEKAAEITFTDKRGMIFYTTFIIYGLYVLYQYAIKKRHNIFSKISILNKYMLVFLISSYIVWICIFGIFRYLIIIEMCCAIFFTKIMLKLNSKNDIIQIFIYSTTIVILYILISTPVESRGWPRLREKSSDKFIYMEPIKLPKNSKILFIQAPSAIFIPLLAQNNAEFSTISYYNFIEHDRENFPISGQGKIRNKFLAENTDKIIAIFAEEEAMIPGKIEEMVMNSIIYDKIQKIRQNRDCRELKTNMTKQHIICFPKEIKTSDTRN